MYRDRYQQRYQISVKGCALGIWRLVSWYFWFSVYFYLWGKGFLVFHWVFSHPVFVDNILALGIHPLFALLCQAGQMDLYYFTITGSIVHYYYMRRNWMTWSTLVKVFHTCLQAIFIVGIVYSIVMMVGIAFRTDPPKDFNVFHQSKANLCGDGQQRLMTISYVCPNAGSSESLVSHSSTPVNLPGRCEYNYTIETCAACSRGCGSNDQRCGGDANDVSVSTIQLALWMAIKQAHEILATRFLGVRLCLHWTHSKGRKQSNIVSLCASLFYEIFYVVK
jgi:hypothetical protein